MPVIMSVKNAITDERIRIMFVCLGNICRSPLAECVFQTLVEDAGLEERFEVHSSGTGSWHVGDLADARMRETARRFGHSLDVHRGRQLKPHDLARDDHIFVMDKSNLHDVLFLDPTDEHSNKVRLFREFDPAPDDYQVPDPYYGGEEGFENVYRIVERTARSLLSRLIDAHHLQDGHDSAA